MNDEPMQTLGADMDEMNDVEQSKDTTERKPGLSRPDFFTRVASSHLSRRDMVKSSVVAGGLVWAAPMLLSSSRAEALETCCPSGSSNLTVTIAPDGTVGCGTPTCLVGNPPCDADDTIACIDDFVIVGNDTISIGVTLPIVGTINVNVNIMTIALQGVTLAAIAAQSSTAFLTPNACTVIGGCPDLSLLVAPLPFSIQAGGLIAIVTGPVTVLGVEVIGALDHVELELCIPGTASGLCG